MAKINWTDEARQWLEEIYNYIAQDNPLAAGRVVQNIYDKAQILTKFPEIGYRYDRFPEDHIRIILYGHYRITYLVKKDKNIDILGVFHGALVMDRFFF